jgi:hypothetical protein
VSREANAHENLSSAVGELRSELGALAARLTESSTATGDVLRALRSEVAEVSSLVRPAGAETQLESELRTRVEELERRVEARPEPAAPPAEVPAEEPAPARAPVPGPAPAAEPEPEYVSGYLAFVPTGQGYSLHELQGPPPSIGEPVADTNGDAEFVVARVGRSPLPLDRRQCVYLELAVASDPSDRVT